MKFLSTFLGSFHSADTYRSVRYATGSGFAYSFMLVLFTLFLTCIVILPQLNQAHQVIIIGANGQPPLMDNVLNQIARQTPLMTFKNRTLKTDEPGPHYIHIKIDDFGHKSDDALITVDTSGQTTYANMKTPLLITANEVISKTEKTEIKTFEDIFKDPEDAKIDKRITPEYAEEVAGDISDLVRENIKQFYLITGIIAFIVMVPILYIARIIMVLFLAVAGLAIAAILRIAMPFNMLMRLAAVSFTPVAVLAALAPLMGSGALSVWVLFALGILMLTAAIHASRAEEGTAA